MIKCFFVFFSWTCIILNRDANISWHICKEKFMLLLCKMKLSFLEVFSLQWMYAEITILFMCIWVMFAVYNYYVLVRYLRVSEQCVKICVNYLWKQDCWYSCLNHPSIYRFLWNCEIKTDISHLFIVCWVFVYWYSNTCYAFVQNYQQEI